MSKRFGRNQKRKMRERIAELETDRDRWKKRHDEVRMLGQRDRLIVKETADVLGSHFITMDPDNAEIRDIDQVAHGWRVPIMQDLPLSPLEPGAMTCRKFMERVLPVLHGSVIANDLRGEVHIRFKYDGEIVGYSISRRALLMMPQKYAVEKIATEMARYLVGHLKDVRKGVAR
jgi:hypothetical protein